MSTDDLTRRAREWAADPASTERTSALVSELADEVDRLRALHADLTSRLGYGDGITDPQADNDTIVRGVDEARMEACDLGEVTTERDAARAALERVRAIGAVIAFECAHHEDREGETPALRVSGGWRDVSDYAQDITRALEGEPS